MAIVAAKRQQLVGEYRIHEKDTGSPEVQIALLTEQINSLTEHLKRHPKDELSRHGMLLMISRRNRLLKYLSAADRARYVSLIGRLGLRK